MLVRRLRRTHGEEGLTRLLELAGSERTVAYLDELTNWISYDEAMALFRAAEEITGDPRIARRVGEETIAQHAGTPVATLMRSLGSPEEIYRQITQAGSKFTTASVLEAPEVEPGRAVIRERACDGFERTVQHCDWAKGLLSQPTALFGLPPATVEESACQARGDEACVYEITWDAELAALTSDPVQHVTVLEGHISAMTERLDSLYATAADLIADSDLDSVLARITERAATAVRAPRYLLAVRTDDESGLHSHHSGFDEHEAADIAERLIDVPAYQLPASWLVAEVRSHRRYYGRLVAMADVSFFAQERYLLELYARYAATALDGATALAVATRGHEEAQALLELARALADATTSDQVVRALVDAVPSVVDCDRVSVWVWDEEARRARLPRSFHRRRRAARPLLHALPAGGQRPARVAALEPDLGAAVRRPRVRRPLRHRHARAVRRRGGHGRADRGPRRLPRHADGDGHLRARPAAAGGASCSTASPAWWHRPPRRFRRPSSWTRSPTRPATTG